MEWSVECLIKTTSPHHNLLRENGIGNLAADRQIHYTDNTGACRVSFVTASDHGGVAPPVVSHTCRGETLVTDFHGQERLACFFTDREGNPRCCFIKVIHLDYNRQVVNLRASLRNSRPLSKPSQPVQYENFPVQNSLAVSDKCEIGTHRLPIFSDPECALLLGTGQSIS